MSGEQIQIWRNTAYQSKFEPAHAIYYNRPLATRDGSEQPACLCSLTTPSPVACPYELMMDGTASVISDWFVCLC